MNSRAFTLAEILVVIAVLSIMGVVLTEIFFRSVRGGNKAEVLTKIKQNGQSAMGILDKTIRESDLLICPKVIGSGTLTANTLVIVKGSTYTRYRMVLPRSGFGGNIEQDNPHPGQEPIEQFLIDVCQFSDPPDPPTVVSLTDQEQLSGVSVINGIFLRNRQTGFKDLVTISFTLGPAPGVSQAISSQIEPVTFSTTVELR